MALFLDIETAKDAQDQNYIAWKTAGISAPGNYKDPIKIEEYVNKQKDELISKFPLNPLTGKIILIGLLTNKQLYEEWGEPTHQYKGEKFWLRQIDDFENNMLNGFWTILHKHALNDGSHLITFNGKQFDLPFILHRSAILNIHPPSRIVMDKLLNKYNNSVHVDLYNWFGSGSQVEWCYRMGITNSLERDGGKIPNWYEQGQMDLIKQKNSIDLFQMAEQYQRIKDWL